MSKLHMELLLLRYVTHTFSIYITYCINILILYKMYYIFLLCHTFYYTFSFHFILFKFSTETFPQLL